MAKRTYRQRFSQIGAGLLLGLTVVACQTTEEQASIDSSAQTTWPASPSEPRFYYERAIHGSNDLVVQSSAEKFKSFATGLGASGTNIAKPFGIVVHNRRMFVGDSVARLVHLFDFNTKSYKEIGTEGPGGLAKPMGVAIDGKNRLYVVDATAKRVVIYDSEGNYLGAINGRKILERPSGIAVNKEGTKVFVVDTGGVSSTKHAVQVFSTKGEYLYQIGKRGHKEGELNLPVNATIGPNGVLYVVDGGNFRIQAFSQDGKFLSAFGKVGRKTGQFARPKSISVDADNNIYVTDAAFGNVQIFNSDYKLLMWIGSRSSENKPGGFMLPSGLAVDRADGRLYLADQYFRKIEIYRPAALGKPELNKK